MTRHPIIVDIPPDATDEECEAMAEAIGQALLQRRAQVLRAKAEAGDEHAAALLAEQEEVLSKRSRGGGSPSG